MRKSKDKDGNVVYKLAETQAVSWARKMLEHYDCSNNTVIDLRTVKE